MGKRSLHTTMARSQIFGILLFGKSFENVHETIVRPRVVFVESFDIGKVHSLSQSTFTMLPVDIVAKFTRSFNFYSRSFLSQRVSASLRAVSFFRYLNSLSLLSV